MAEEAPTIESQVQTAMRSRVSYFKEQSDSLTFEGVRRLLEKDLGLEKCALDVHKRVIKQLLLECIGGADDDNAPKNSGESESVGKPREETAESEHQLKKDVEDEKMEDSPVLGLMTGSKTSKNEKKETESIASEVPSENTIKKAVRARASYVRENSDKVTMAGLRRLLEKDLGLDEHTLDPYKKLISAQLDEALNSSECSESPTEVEKKKVKKGSQIKSSEKGSSDENSDASGSESEEVEEEEEEEEEEEKPRKKIIRKEKLQKSEPKKRKRPVKEAKASSTKQVKLAKRMSVKKSAAEDSEHEDDNSQSSAENPVKKKEVPTPAYGKRVEHLKSVIKSCGMGVPPVIYKKVKQVSENKREAALIKELEEILSKEGLSANPSEKEIKEVRRRKERARELEGIDTSNIVSSSRRRSTTSFTAPPPKPKIPVESDHSGSSDSDDEDSDDGDDEDNEDEGDEENGDSQSEEADDDNDDDSD